MRIVQLLPSLEIGGLERLALDLALQQRIDGHEPTLYCTRDTGPLALEAEAAGIPVRVFGKTDGFSFRLLYQLAASLKRDRPDVLHAHNALVLHYGIAAARLAHTPVVVNTRHGGNLRWDTKSERLWSRVVPLVDRLIFVSEEVRDYFVARNGISRNITEVIRNGVNLARFSQRLTRRSGGGSGFRFGTVGRLSRAKDHVTLTRAFAVVAAVWPEAELHIMGGGPCRTAVEQTAAALGIAKRIKLHGAGLDVGGFLGSLDLFVLSSLDEGLPLVLQEAMAAGLPIVSTRLPGLPRVAPEGKVAWYCPPGDPYKLAALMLQVAQRSDLDRIGALARQLAVNFSIDETWRRYRDLFERILYGRRKRSPWPRIHTKLNTGQ